MPPPTMEIYFDALLSSVHVFVVHCMSAVITLMTSSVDRGMASTTTHVTVLCFLFEMDVLACRRRWREGRRVV